LAGTMTVSSAGSLVDDGVALNVTGTFTTTGYFEPSSGESITTAVSIVGGSMSVGDIVMSDTTGVRC